MGWLFSPSWDRASLAEHLLHGNGLKTLKHAWRGNNLWAVQEYERDGKVTRFVALYLCRGRNGSRDGWGYKDIDEGMGPYYYNCPISFIEMVEAHEKEFGYGPRGYAAEWRATVREKAVLAKRKLVVGQEIELYGREYAVTKVLDRGYYRVVDKNGDVWRLPPRQIKDVKIKEVA